MNIHNKFIKQFVDHYIQAALWSSVDDHDRPLDDHNYELAEETKRKLYDHCVEFLKVANDEIISNRENFPSAKIMYQQAGHDFWLTRCGHGVGFWDRPEFWGENETLSDISEKFGNVDLYIGDDNLIYVM